ncbi:DUF4303 domain-containing protein [Flavobacterium oreochromis]|uniref:DUF4303 domain-containing protein n=1 Tax=Flavobacterium oreochromis TaxID=2906078 RepID=UPI00385892A4
MVYVKNSNATSISISYNTLTFLNQRIEEDPEEDKNYFRWYPAEWKEEGVESTQIDALSRMMYEVSKNREIPLESFRKQIFDSIVNTLISIKEKGYFNDFGKDFVLVFYATDYFVVTEEIDWINRLNSKELSSEFENWRNKF